jgi:hypothetical protein
MTGSTSPSARSSKICLTTYGMCKPVPDNREELLVLKSLLILARSEGSQATQNLQDHVKRGRLK